MSTYPDDGPDWELFPGSSALAQRAMEREGVVETDYTTWSMADLERFIAECNDAVAASTRWCEQRRKLKWAAFYELQRRLRTTV